ncbi:response regulator [Novosphingobium sp.]|uniref:response regulator n=1 Tax=Novosphingobium sp. TaxID=1874826 RepID=UPI00333E5CBF
MGKAFERILSGGGAPVGRVPANGVPGRCTVLLVDDDPITLEAYADIAASLGYTCVQAADALTALRLVAEDPAIGIVVTDVQMPAMDGLSLLDELAVRFGPTRPIVSIVSTGFASMDVAVQAMRNKANDFLSKPVSAQDLAAALRRACGQWAQLAMRNVLNALTPMPQGAAAAAPAAGADAGPPSNEDLLVFARAMQRSRGRRGAFFDSQLFGDPCWDIMLDLVCGQLEDRSVAVSGACAATGLPFSTALRHVRQLVDLGLVRRWQDPQDRRRDLLVLEDATFDAMKRYLGETRNRMP